MFKEIINYFRLKKLLTLEKLVGEKSQKLDNLRSQREELEKKITFSKEQANILKVKLEEQSKNERVKDYNRLSTEYYFILNDYIAAGKLDINAPLGTVSQKAKLGKTVAAIKLELDSVKTETTVREYIDTSVEYNQQSIVISKNEQNAELLNIEIRKTIKERRALREKLSKLPSKSELRSER